MASSRSSNFLLKAATAGRNAVTGRATVSLSPSFIFRSFLSLHFRHPFSFIVALRNKETFMHSPVFVSNCTENTIIEAPLTEVKKLAPNVQWINIYVKKGGALRDDTKNGAVADYLHV